MIRRIKDTFLLETENTTYIFGIMPSGQPEHMYYGKKLEIPFRNETDSKADNLWADVIRSMTEKRAHVPGNSISYSEEFGKVILEDTCLEFGSYGKGDIREPFVEITFEDGSRTCDFVFEDASITDGCPKMESELPGVYDESAGGGAESCESNAESAGGGTESCESNTENAQTLSLVFKEKCHDISLIINYVVLEKCDAIVRNAKLVNNGDSSVTVNRLMSQQIDFDSNDLMVSDFSGHWAKEMNRNDHAIISGKFVNSTVAGISSNRANPFMMISKADTTEENGNCYGINLLYSGNHYEAFEVSGHGKTRFVQGINPSMFSWNLRLGESFESPQAVCIYSDLGYGGMSEKMHIFVREHVVRGNYKKKERPVLLNSWEASYFKFDEKSLLKLAKKAAEVGVELFVMDDGWFGKRNDDTTSLGDWEVNKEKLPGGLKRLSKKVNDLGMKFGIWVEPEMVNADSNLYREHPEYAVKIPGRENSLGRNQMLLDLTKSEVQDFVISKMMEVFSSGNISYVKWDMNRIFSDAYSNGLGADAQGEFFHRYILGLYRVLRELTERFPDILFEGCASGGCRFDLGMLCFMPQIWASDNTDASCRAKILKGYSYGYPQSVIGSHVSASPNHQTLRKTPIDTRFNVASFGILGYELNLCDLKKSELKEIEQQIALYKKYRKVLQFGNLKRIESCEGNGGSGFGAINDISKENEKIFTVVSDDKSVSITLLYQDLAKANSVYKRLILKGLDERRIYHFGNIRKKYNIKDFGDLVNTVSPIHIKPDSVIQNIAAKAVKMDGEEEDYLLPGSVLMNSGIKLSQAYGATGYDDKTRLFKDFESRLYFAECFEE